MLKDILLQVQLSRFALNQMTQRYEDCRRPNWEVNPSPDFEIGTQMGLMLDVQFDVRKNKHVTFKKVDIFRQNNKSTTTISTIIIIQTDIFNLVFGLRRPENGSFRSNSKLIYFIIIFPLVTKIIIKRVRIKNY